MFTLLQIVAEACCSALSGLIGIALREEISALRPKNDDLYRVKLRNMGHREEY